MIEECALVVIRRLTSSRGTSLLRESLSKEVMSKLSPKKRNLPAKKGSVKTVCVPSKGSDMCKSGRCKRPSPAYKYLINVKCVQSKKQALGTRDKMGEGGLSPSFDDASVSTGSIILSCGFQRDHRDWGRGSRMQSGREGLNPSGGRDHFTPSAFTHVCHDIQSHPIGKDHSFIITIIMITIIVYFWMTFSLQSVSHACSSLKFPKL